MEKSAPLFEEKPKTNTFVLRLLTGTVIIMALAVALLLREVTVYLFDVFTLGLAGVAVFEVIKAKNNHQKSLAEHAKAEKKRPASVAVKEPRIINSVYIYIYLVFVYAMFVLGVSLTTPFTFVTHIIIQLIMLLVFTVYIFLMHYMDTERVRYCRVHKISLGSESWRYTLEHLKIILYPALLIFALIPLNHLGQIAPVLENACAAGCTEAHTHIVSAASINIGLYALLTVFAVSCLTDTFAYLTGRWLKGPKLVPSVSPNKTISGAVGGLFGGILGALLVMLAFTGNQFFLDFFTSNIGNVWAVRMTVIAVGLLGSVLTQAGDIYASCLKRRTETKDFGTYLPGHGGIMDRMDGICFNAVFMFICFMLLVFVL